MRSNGSLTFFTMGLLVSDAVVVVVVVAQEVVAASGSNAALFMHLSTGKPSISGKSPAGQGKESEIGRGKRIQWSCEVKVSSLQLAFAQ